jgi:hypothetical protein
LSTIIGIDLGTTNSTVAYMAEDGPRLIPNALGEVLTPSVVGLDDDDKLLVGRAAGELQVTRPERCVGLFKRRMGSDWHAELGRRKFSPEELSSLILRSLKEDASGFLKEPVERAVVTVPAYFNDQQRKATIAAGHIAGLQVERIFNEPTAAALAYGFHEARDEKILLIFDLGGGTFDVSVVELFEGTLEVRASSGESFLGGEDFTRTLAARLLEQQGHHFERAELQAPLMIARMIQQCERAKCSVSRQDSFTLRIPNTKGEYNDSSPETTVTRQQFDAWTQHILNRVELPIRRVLGDAKLTKEDVHEVILVGGATRMPAVIDRVTQLLGKSPHRRINPDQVVALGAAVQAGLIARSDDLSRLRPGLAAGPYVLVGEHEDVWLRLLAAAADQLAWAPAAAGFPECLQEAARYEHLQLRCADVFDRLESLERLAIGWHRAMNDGNVPVELLEVLRLFWTQGLPEIRRRLLALLGTMAADAAAWLGYLDNLNAVSPPLLALFGQVLASHQWSLSQDEDGRDAAELMVLARRFLEEHGKLEYSLLRPRLLAFCLRELIHPDMVTHLATSQVVTLPDSRLSKLVNDWPLRQVYQACLLHWS